MSSLRNMGHSPGIRADSRNRAEIGRRLTKNSAGRGTSLTPCYHSVLLRIRAPAALRRWRQSTTMMANRESAFIEITPEVLLKAYACGIFPMAESAEDPALYWIEPEKRGIIPLDRFHV